MAREHGARDCASGIVKEVARPFLKLGTIAFGGLAAHIAMMDDEIVRKPEWATRERFLGLMAVVTWQPGRAALVDRAAVGQAIAATALVFRLRINSAWLVLGGGLIGLAPHLLR